jgi:formylglycine-generating enzyme required for sulfatase activity
MKGVAMKTISIFRLTLVAFAIAMMVVLTTTHGQRKSGVRRKSTPPKENAQSRAGRSYEENINGTVLEMVLIPAGTFLMGSPDSEEQRGSEEGPQHQVSVPQFYMGKYEVTQAQWRAVMGKNPSWFKGDNLPVEQVSGDDAEKFCKQLSELTGKEYRLPTEAEWEYACRAGTTTPFAFGSSLSSNQANFAGDNPYGRAVKGVDRRKTTPVGSFQPNAWGLYDMHGNVWEWCQDTWHESYDGAPTDGSAWERDAKPYRMVRGGSWDTSGVTLRSAYRHWISPYNDLWSTFGFRVVASAR